MSDPVARSSKVLSVLGADSVPEGYYPAVAFSIPFVMDVAMLTDVEPEGEGTPDGFNVRGFIYTKMLGFGQDEQELRDFFEGRTDDYDVLEDNGINMDIEEALGRGVFDLDEARVMYVAQRGEVDVQDQRAQGLTSLGLIDCPEDERRRIAIWFGPDIEGDDFTGTAADPEAFQAFLSHFTFCR
jgi:hypothetical protein